MCGICGVVLEEDDVAPMIVDTLTSLQHRGQDAAGMSVTNEAGRTLVRKGNGLVADVFREEREVQQLLGRYGVGHVRYPTAGSSDGAESQPFSCNYPWGLSLAHNGNLTNVDELRHYCRTALRRQINTGSDSELILAVFAHELARHYDSAQTVSAAAAEEAVFAAVSTCMRLCEGAYAIIVSVTGVGVVGFRDPHGIRPLVFGTRADGAILASESVAVEINGFAVVRDVRPGEAVLLRADVEKERACARDCAPGPTQLSPCIFEFVYFARPDSVIDGACVHDARVHMGDRLARRIRAQHPDCAIDVVVPVPSTSRVSAVQCAVALGVPYMEGLVRNRYTQRTFIMPGQKKRKKGVRMKLNPVASVIRGRAVLLVDDSIVRGTTSKHIVEIVRAAGATAVYVASAAPPIRHPNVYGIDMPTFSELIAYGRDEAQVAAAIGADWVVYQAIEDLVGSVRACNPALTSFDMSCFDGVYCAGKLPDSYFEKLGRTRGEARREDEGADPAKTIARYASPFHAGRVEVVPPSVLRSSSASPRGGGGDVLAENSPATSPALRCSPRLSGAAAGSSSAGSAEPVASGAASDDGAANGGGAVFNLASSRE